MEAKRMRIMIGYDGSPCADAMLDDMRRAGLPCHAEALIVTVAERWLPRPTEVVLAEASLLAPVKTALQQVALSLPKTGALGLASELALKARKHLQASFPEWEISATALSGSPARELLTHVEAWQPDLLCVGSQGRSALGHLLLGSVSAKLANEALCSVRVARGDVWKYGAPVRIAIGLDGSAGAQAAVSVVARRLWPMDSEVRLIVVEDSAAEAAAGSTATLNHVNNNHVWVQEMIETAARELRAAALTVSSRIAVGDPKQLLLAEAEEWGADCLFVGARGAHQPLLGMLLGSVSTAVVARAHCTVEVVRTR